MPKGSRKKSRRHKSRTLGVYKVTFRGSHVGSVVGFNKSRAMKEARKRIRVKRVAE